MSKLKLIPSSIGKTLQLQLIVITEESVEIFMFEPENLVDGKLTSNDGKAVIEDNSLKFNGEYFIPTEMRDIIMNMKLFLMGEDSNIRPVLEDIEDISIVGGMVKISTAYEENYYFAHEVNETEVFVLDYHIEQIKDGLIHVRKDDKVGLLIDGSLSGEIFKYDKDFCDIMNIHSELFIAFPCGSRIIISNEFKAMSISIDMYTANGYITKYGVFEFSPCSGEFGSEPIRTMNINGSDRFEKKFLSPYNETIYIHCSESVYELEVRDIVDVSNSKLSDLFKLPIERSVSVSYRKEVIETLIKILKD